MKKIASIIAAMCVWIIPGMATTGAEAESLSPSVWSNPLFLTLLGVVIVLALLIGVLGTVIANLLKYKLGLGKWAKKGAAALLLFSILTQPNQLAAAADYGGINAGAFWLLIVVIAVELFVVSWFVLVIYRIFEPEKQAVSEAIVTETKVKKVGWLAKMWSKMNDSVEIEKEADALLDHDYDGIKELDNNLPPWWKYGFYLSIVFAIVYLLWFHVLGGPSSAEELERSLAKAEKEIEAYKALQSDLVDENTVQLLTSADDLIAGKNHYLDKKCTICHGLAGEGSSMAPNLTDDYWLHGGSVNDVFKTIKYGIAGKGMQSWKNEFSAKEMAQLSSYVLSLQGTNPANPWEPQGEKYEPTQSEETETEDSTDDEEQTSSSPLPEA